MMRAQPFDEGNGMVDGGVVKGEVFAWNKAVNAGDGAAIGW